MINLLYSSRLETHHEKKVEATNIQQQQRKQKKNETVENAVPSGTNIEIERLVSTTTHQPPALYNDRNIKHVYFHVTMVHLPCNATVP